MHQSLIKSRVCADSLFRETLVKLRNIEVSVLKIIISFEFA